MNTNNIPINALKEQKRNKYGTVTEQNPHKDECFCPSRAHYSTYTYNTRVSLCLPWAMRSLGFQPARFAPLTVSSACPLRLPWAMRSLGFAMHYWLHLSNSSMLDCIRFERSFSPFETKSETLVKTIRNRRRRSAPPTPLKCCFESKKCKITCMNSKDIISL